MLSIHQYLIILNTDAYAFLEGVMQQIHKIKKESPLK
jgi:hypothetical protein